MHEDCIYSDPQTFASTTPTGMEPFQFAARSCVTVYDTPMPVPSSFQDLNGIIAVSFAVVVALLSLGITLWLLTYKENK